MHHEKKVFANRSMGEWLVSLPTFFILLTVIFLGSGEYLHSQLLKFGESQWDQYFILRGDIPDPDCNPNPDIEAETNRLVSEAQASQADELDLFQEEVNPDAIRQSVVRSAELCQEKWSIAKQNQERVTDDVRFFRAIETGVAKLITFVGQYKQLMLCALIIVCAAWTTLTRHHIGLRPVETKTDYYLATSLQLVAHLMLMFSEIAYRNAEIKAMEEGVQVQFFFLHAWWITGFAVLALISVWQLVNPPKDLREGGGIGHAILSIPLYTFMAVSASIQFWVVPAIELLATGEVQQAPYYQGIGVYLSQMMELSGMFLSLALYIWIGMLLKQTRVVELFFDLLRPWKLSPELMCFVVLVIAASPTAYTGASGIFVIAAGAVIYQELMRSGARPQLALASTAMSGSMGVVLAPCLLVVIIAALNGDVTTGEMYHYGFFIYLMTAMLFFLVAQATRREPARIAPVREALPLTLKAIVPLLPYIAIIAAVILFFKYALNQNLDEFSAPYILPFVLLVIVIYDKMTRKEDPAHSPAAERRRPIEIAFREATNETTTHIGALLMLMALSVSIGGTIERSHVMDLFPHVDSIWGTMTILVVVMVIIGMIMDPYGAVILVNATIAQVAFEAGIHPLHFWMFALMSFELGYLTPPVALNHLLTRHIVGEKAIQLAVADGQRYGSFWYRHEKYLLPVTIMFIGLMVVAYGPLAWKEYGWAEQVPDWVNVMLTYTKE